METESIIVHLHSKEGQRKTFGYTTDIDFQLDAPVRADFQNFSGSVRVEASLVSATIPHSWYCFDEDHNSLIVLVWDDTNDAYAGTFEYFFPAGNYDGATVATILQDGVIASSSYPYDANSLWQEAINSLPYLSTVDNEFSPLFRYYSVLNKFAARGAIAYGNTSNDFSIYLIGDTLPDKNILPSGLTQDEYETIPVSNVGNLLGIDKRMLIPMDDGYEPFDNICSGNRIHNMYLKANFCRTAISPWDQNRGNVLAVIPVESDQSFGDNVVYTPPNANEITVVSPDELNRINLSLVDENNDLIQLNGREWFASIQFRVIKNKYQREHLQNNESRLSIDVREEKYPSSEELERRLENIRRGSEATSGLGYDWSRPPKKRPREFPF